MESILLQSGVPTGPVILFGLLVVVLLYGSLKTNSGSSNSSKQEPNYYDIARRHLKQVSRYHLLSDRQQEFLIEYGADLLQRGFDLKAEGSRLQIMESNESVANFTITDTGSIDMMAYVEPNGWETVDPDPRDYTESELKGKQNQLDRYLRE